MVDQLMLYDQALLTWLTANISTILTGRSTQILVATPRRAYAEVTTGRVVDNDTLTFPRISVSRLDHQNDPTRYNAFRFRRLGWCSDTYQRKIKSGRFPVPINIAYQVDLWTRFVTEMNLWEQKFLMEFAAQYLYLQIRPDDIWQNKMYPVFLDSPISDTSDLEPGDGERAIRKTVSLRAEAWLFDQDTTPVSVVKQIEMQWRDFDTEDLFDRQFLPPKETIATGDGSQVSFGPITLDRIPILEKTLVIETVIGAATSFSYDDGSGNLFGDDIVSGTINYTTGVISFILAGAPDNLELVTASYFTDLS